MVHLHNINYLKLVLSFVSSCWCEKSKCFFFFSNEKYVKTVNCFFNPIAVILSLHGLLNVKGLTKELLEIDHGSYLHQFY